ncbi:hypothetical protein CPB86DRAFT_783600 [Serendipita vermifera]|nr:hypothetical protein CPB86DRAFT_783600 [Serendipita vermifera]
MTCPRETLNRLADRSGDTHRYKDIAYIRLDETPWVESHWYINEIRYGLGSGPNADEARKMAATMAVPRLVALLDARGIDRGDIVPYKR